MNVPVSVLLISVAVGGPVLLLALAVLYHGALLSRQHADLESVLAGAGLSTVMMTQATARGGAAAAREPDLERDLLSEHVSSLVTRSADALAERLEQTMAELHEQLTQQRSSLELLLSEPSRTPAAAGMALGRAAGEYVSGESAASVSTQIERLLDEGLSDRAIARELRVGLEEVKIARTRRGRP
ncbi:MAG: hypothetical protein EPO16_05290 [Dehalococcoidia bacterium]|nr:MAG: hypothetical protein EPO16_05290 [Dehalococcoidia bacterium]